MTALRSWSGTPDVRVPKFVGVMAMDVREQAAACGLLVEAPEEPEFPLMVTDYVLRQYPPPGADVPFGTVVTLWFDSGEGGGEGGVREPRTPQPPSGGIRREVNEPGDTGEWALPLH
ncbi:PASTA domain-containing protein [Streptomyces monticola]|uniref:PASTA domain-containing protein n=1 Tax=Streptomyces monticola TaxID=2666263 RepID=A0ABW2JVQ2_9ACTN